MQNFIIQPNQFLKPEIQAFYHSNYSGGAGQWRIEGTVENIICTLKMTSHLFLKLRCKGLFNT